MKNLKNISIVLSLILFTITGTLFVNSYFDCSGGACKLNSSAFVNFTNFSGGGGTYGLGYGVQNNSTARLIPKGSQTGIDSFIAAVNAGRFGGASICSKRNGGWSDYGSWYDNGSWGSCSSCSQSMPTRRDRSCNTPSPSCGGDNCGGSSFETSSRSQSCGVSASWTQLGTCSQTCGGGTYQRRCDATCGGLCDGWASNGTTDWGGSSCNTQACAGVFTNTTGANGVGNYLVIAESEIITYCPYPNGCNVTMSRNGTNYNDGILRYNSSTKKWTINNGTEYTNGSGMNGISTNAPNCAFYDGESDSTDANYNFSLRNLSDPGSVTCTLTLTKQ